MSDKEEEITTAEKLLALFLHLVKTVPNDKELGTTMRAIVDRLLKNQS